MGTKATRSPYFSPEENNNEKVRLLTFRIVEKRINCIWKN